MSTETLRRIPSPILSTVLHALLFSGLAGVFVTPPEYGVSLGRGDFEVSLHSSSKPERVAEIGTVKAKNFVKKAAATAEPGDDLGDDAKTNTSGEASVVEARPDYLSNPAPAYPKRARILKQEGIVYLRAAIVSDGTVRELSISRSSGFELLDESAVAAVKGWRFHPARMGGIPVESVVTIPVRFRLTDAM